MTAPPDDTTTGTSAIIAALRTERDAGLAREATLAEALAARNSELSVLHSERIEQQAATIDVLKVMSASPGDPQPVFDLIVERARAYCGAELAALTLLDGDLLRLHATSGMTAARTQEFATAYPLPVSQAFAGGRAILMRDTVQVADTQVDPGFAQRGTNAWHRSVLAVPLLRTGMPIGAIGLGRPTPGTFSAAQVELLKTFAEQAVIAITSAETYRALQTRTSDLQETLEYQTATSDVLKVISRSAFDLGPVFQVVLETAVRLCRADQATIYRYQDGEYRWAAGYSLSPDYERIEREVRIRPGTGTLVGRVALEGCTVQILDAWSDPLYEVKEDARVGGVHTMLGVPLLRDGVPIGVFGLARRRVEPFTGRQIDLVSTFADQAVIAIENTRLIAEQREALEQQTATAEVLQVINASPGNLTPVFDTILEKAMRLCDAAFGVFYGYDGTSFRTVVTRGVPPAFAAFRERQPPVPSPGSPFGRAFKTRRPVHVFDWLEEPDYKEGTPGGRAIADLGGARTVLNVPLVKDTAVLGMISFYRQQVRPFSDKQIALLENFAAQAVIAMENARLLTEQREALEQQTATAEVLQVINASPGNLAPVFDAMLEKAMRLCEAQFGVLSTYDGERFRRVAAHGMPVAETQGWPEGVVPDPGSALERVVNGDRVVHIPDLVDTDAYRQGVASRLSLVETTGARAALWVALRKEDALLGVFVIYRLDVRAFSDKQIALVQDFAAQAVIAMENARLLDELRARTSDLQESLEYQTATSEVLRVISGSTFDLEPVFRTVAATAARLCRADEAGIVTAQVIGLTGAIDRSRPSTSQRGDGTARRTTLPR